MSFSDNYNLINQLPGYIGWKDKNLSHLGCNNNLAVAFKIKKNNTIVGLSDWDLLVHDETLCLFHEKNDRLALQGQEVKAFHKSSDGQLFYFVKKPLFDQTNRIEGLIYHCHVFDALPRLFNSLQMQIGDYCYIDSVENSFNLSNRELECLFFLLRGKSAKETAAVMKLSKRTVETYIEHIKNKFGCFTKADLIVAAMTHGYMNYIPSRFIQI